MKFYNPFKWHIIKDGHGSYYIRKYTPFPIYLDIYSPQHAWPDAYKDKWCRCHTIEQAEKALDNHLAYVEGLKERAKKDKAVEVHQ